MRSDAQLVLLYSGFLVTIYCLTKHGSKDVVFSPRRKVVRPAERNQSAIGVKFLQQQIAVRLLARRNKHRDDT
jgi:hypothetical protein